MSGDAPTEELPVVSGQPPRSPHWWQQPPSFWPGLVAGILTLAVSISIVALAIAAAIAESRHDTSISQSAAALLSTSLGGALGAVATYIGLSYAERRAGAPRQNDSIIRSAPDPPEPPEAP